MLPEIRICQPYAPTSAHFPAACSNKRAFVFGAQAFSRRQIRRPAEPDEAIVPERRFAKSSSARRADGEVGEGEGGMEGEGETKVGKGEERRREGREREG